MRPGSRRGARPARIEQRQLGVEVAGLRIGVCPGVLGHVYLGSILRSASVAPQPVTISQVVGSTVRSITSVSARPPSVRPIDSLASPAPRRAGSGP